MKGLKAGGVSVLLLLAASGLTLLGFEVFLRLFLPQKLYRFPRGLFQNDPELVFTMNPHFDGILTSPEFRTHVHTNSLGLRGGELDSKTPGSFRVMVLGDSFVTALNMSEEDTFVSAMRRALSRDSKKLRIEVVNAGTPNYGTWHELRLLNRLFPLLDPDLVVLCVFVGNDLADNLRPKKAVVLDGLLVERKRPSGILPDPIRSWLQRKSMAYVFIWNAWNQVKGILGGKSIDPLGEFKSIIAPNSSSAIEEGYRVSGELLRQMSTSARSHGVPLLIVLIPEELQTYPEEFKTMLGKSEQGKIANYDLTLPNSRWKDLALAAGLPVIDLLPVFRAHLDGPHLFMPLDGHLTAEGNRIAGETIAEGLRPLILRATGGLP